MVQSSLWIIGMQGSTCLNVFLFVEQRTRVYQFLHGHFYMIISKFKVVNYVTWPLWLLCTIIRWLITQAWDVISGIWFALSFSLRAHGLPSTDMFSRRSDPYCRAQKQPTISGCVGMIGPHSTSMKRFNLDLCVNTTFVMRYSCTNAVSDALWKIIDRIVSKMLIICY